MFDKFCAGTVIVVACVVALTILIAGLTGLGMLCYHAPGPGAFVVFVCILLPILAHGSNVLAESRRKGTM